MWTSSLESNHNSPQSPCAPDLFRPLLLCRCPQLLPQSQAQRSCKSPVACLCLVGQGRTQKNRNHDAVPGLGFGVQGLFENGGTAPWHQYNIAIGCNRDSISESDKIYPVISTRYGPGSCAARRQSLTVSFL